MPFSELSEKTDSHAEILTKLVSYAKFLTERSELIGWEQTSKSIKLYPRVLFGYTEFGVGLVYPWTLLHRIITKKHLTTIQINVENLEVALQITREDYSILNNVTYHLLGQQLLERFKRSIMEYLKGNLEQAYTYLLPLQI